MADVDLTTLRARTRERCDMVNNNFVTDEPNSLDAFLNASAKRLYGLMARSGQDYFDTTAEITLTANAEELDLPAGVLILRGVDVQVNGKWWGLKKFNLGERNRYRNAQVPLLPPYLVAMRYRLRGQKLLIYPAPQTNLPGQIIFAPEMTPLVDGADAIDFPNGWEEWVVVDAAIKALVKEESDVSDLRQEAKELWEDILRNLNQRDQGGVATITDVQRDDCDDGWGAW